MLNQKISKRTVVKRGVILVLCLTALAALAAPVYAGCGTCVGSVKAFASVLNKNKMTLAAAATLAEVKTKGTAVQALTHRHAGGVSLEIYCVVDSKIIAVTVDGATGKIKSQKAVSSLGDHG